MRSLTQFLLIGATALSALCAVSAEAHTATPRGEQVLAAHRQVVSPSAVAYHRHHHRRHHHVRRPAHR